MATRGACAFVVRRWFAERKWPLSAILLAVGSLTLHLAWLSSFPATIILTSESDLSDVDIVLERNPPLQRFGGPESGRRFAWDTDLARGAGMFSGIHVMWRGSDGRRHRIHEELVHPEELHRCIHFLRVNASGEAIPAWFTTAGEPRVINSICR